MTHTEHSRMSPRDDGAPTADELAAELAALPRVDLPSERAAAILARTRAEFERRTERGAALARVVDAYERWVEPVALTGVCALYLAWAVAAALPP